MHYNNILMFSLFGEDALTIKAAIAYKSFITATQMFLLM